jgi:hypothetical protein
MAVDPCQTYTDPRALERLRNGQCPECGGTTYAHGGWGGPRGCSLTDNGVAHRIAYQAQLDEAAAVPNTDPGALDHVHDWSPAWPISWCMVEGCGLRYDQRSEKLIPARTEDTPERVDR